MCTSESFHPFETAAQFEAAIAPYMALSKPRHIRSDLYMGGSFRVRLLHAGVAFMEMYEYQLRSRHPRLRFRGTFVEFLRKLLTDMACYFTNPDDAYAPEHREIARLYGIALPHNRGECQPCLPSRCTAQLSSWS